MNTIQEISALSNYRPEGGDLLHVFELLTEDLTRSEAMALWRKEGKSDEHFRWVYKRLKERLLKGMIVSSFSEFEEHKRRRMECWRRFAEVKVVLVADKRESAMELATEVLREAEKCSMVEVALSLARDLAYQYGVLEVDLQKYRRYCRKVRLYWEELGHEKQAQELLTELGFLLHKKREIDGLENEIMTLSGIESQGVRFNLFRYSALVTWHHAKEEHTKIIETCLKAISFFDKVDSPMPYTAKWHFYINLIPYLIANGDFALAESKIKSCLALPLEGSHNWHITLLQMALLGFRSEKPKMAFWAWAMAAEHPSDSSAVMENWEIVFAYLAILDKLGRMQLEREFRLSRFVNSVEASKLSVRIAVMMHHLLDNNKIAYMKEADRVPDYLKKEHNARGRYLLKMLAKVEKGDYYRIRVSAMAKKEWTGLKRTPKPVFLNFADDEVIQFDILWDIVVSRLR